jgi:Tol biopolymer transport system component
VVSGAQGSTTAASARNGLIAFDHGGQIYTMTPAGTHVRLLTTAGRPSVEPSFSPDGRQLVFVRDARNGNHELWTMNADGSHQSRLTWTKRIGEEDAVWSPDGTQIAFDGGRGASRGIWIMNRNGSGRRLVVPGGGEPRWSPNGTLIAFLSPLGPIGVVPAVGGPTTVLDPDSRDNDGNINWTPDGRIVFSRWERVRPHFNGIQTDLWVMDADGSNLHRITTTPGFDEDQPVWAPGGTKILFAAQNNGMGRYLGGPGIELYTVNVNGTNRRQLTHGKTHESNYFDPSWQPLR